MLNGIIFLSLMALAAWPAYATPASTQSHSPVPEEQVLFLIDDSASMSQRAFALPTSKLSRFGAVQRAYPEWLARLDHQQVRIGTRSIGGACGSPPRINLPVGSDPRELAKALAAPTKVRNIRLNSRGSVRVPISLAPGA